MANINIRIDDKLEIELKKRAKESGYKTLSDYIRSILKENHQEEQLSRVTIEAEIEKLEEAQNQFSEVQTKLLKRYMYDSKFMTSLFYYFMIAAANEETAHEAWKKAKSEMEK
jgi:Arc/MetJ-type ribon-helix-helix transcriptional regulator